MNKDENQYHKFKIIWDLLVVAILAVAFFPFAQRYYQAVPPMGADFYQFPTYVRYLSEHLTLPTMSWKYIWFDGVPLITDYSWLFFYLAIPFAKTWGLVAGSKIFLLVTVFLYFLFAYLFLKVIANSRWFALAATVALMSTTNIYYPLTYGGNATYAATQFFLPLVLWLITKYYRGNKRKFLFLAVLLAGLAYFGHAGTALIFVWVPALIFLLCWWDEKVALINTRKIKDVLFYLITSLGIGFLPLYAIAFLIMTIPKAANFTFFQEGGIIHIQAIKGLFQTQNFFLLTGTIILLVLAALRIRSRQWHHFFPFLGLASYILVFEFLYMIGRNPFGGGIMPPRTYWFFAFIITGVGAVAWNLITYQAKELNTLSKLQKAITSLLLILILVTIFLSPVGTLADLSNRIFKMNPQEIGVATNFYDYETAQSTLGEKLLGNDLRLEKFNIDTLLAQKTITAADKEKLKGYLIPSWLDTNELNYRFHTLEVGVNIWWSALFNLPLTHGSYNSAHVESNNYAYWTDMAFHGELITRWKHPISIAKNNLLFLIDWQAIRYLLGNEIEVGENSQYSLEKSIAAPYSVVTFLTKDPSLVDLRGVDGATKSAVLNYFRIKESIVSPIAKTTNAPVMLIIGDQAMAYDNVLRNLAHLNLNSRYLIPVRGPVSLDAVSNDDLRRFDIVYMQFYKATGGGWKKLENYVKEGGNVIIETGGEVGESESKNLPEIFPVTQTARGSLGQTWNLSASDEALLEGVDTQKFGKLEYDGSPWKLSYTEASLVKNWGRTVLSQNNKPILVVGNLGQGKVVWSGMNLSYHFNQYYSETEGQLFKNILGSMVRLEDEGTLDFKVSRPTSERIIIEGSNFKGTVLKENNYGGWSAWMVSPYVKKLEIYNAGLGFSYVRLPKDVTGSAQIEFSYRGSFFNWFFFVLAVILSVWLIIKSVTRERLDKGVEKISLFTTAHKKARDKLSAWWEKEEE